MHRTRTAAALLITLTASAVSGCVSAGGPPAPHARPDAASPPPAPRADQGAEPRLVTSPAHEALRRMGPPARESTGSARVPEQERRDRSSAHSGEVPGSAPAGAARATDRQRTPGSAAGSRSAAGQDRSGAALPVPGGPLAPGGDACGLGEEYGGWAPDSPQGRICRDLYGS